ncbi:hypothetical protein AB4Y36_34815 [Paraburkholderia sp. BR10936]|uniref:hypothetical protein n=1 Tax=Paraburkholderia sp. BR10936 TaxID=3236993 RepID=UPI0034D2DE81
MLKQREQGIADDPAPGVSVENLMSSRASLASAFHSKPAAFGILVSDYRSAGAGRVNFEYVANFPALGL